MKKRRVHRSLLNLQSVLCRDVIALIWKRCSWADVQTAFAAHGCTRGVDCRKYISACIAAGETERVKWIAEHCGGLYDGACREAVRKYQFETWTYIHSVRCACDGEMYPTCEEFAHMVIFRAGQSGHWSDVFAYHEAGCPYCVSLCSQAAAQGDLDALIRLRETGCPWNQHTSYHAAMSDYWHVVKWVVEHGGAMHDVVMSLAIDLDQDMMIRWLIENNQRVPASCRASLRDKWPLVHAQYSQLHGDVN